MNPNYNRTATLYHAPEWTRETVRCSWSSEYGVKQGTTQGSEMDQTIQTTYVVRLPCITCVQPGDIIVLGECDEGITSAPRFLNEHKPNAFIVQAVKDNSGIVDKHIKVTG